jgi:hypothetical protein
MQVGARLLISSVSSEEELARESEKGRRAPLMPAVVRDWKSSERPVHQRPTQTRLALANSLVDVGAGTWNPLGQRQASKSRSPLEPEAEINALYREARRLIPLAAKDPEAEARYQATMQRLRELQQREAEKWVARFRSQCHLQPGEGYAALQRADELIAKYAHLAPTNLAPEGPNLQAPPTKASE